MDDEALIEAVQQYVEIYDFSHPKYCDGPHRTRLWMKIGNEVRQDPSKCKARWESLRSQFRKQLRNQRSKGRDASLFRWRFADNLRFLLPFMKEKARMHGTPTLIKSIIKEDHQVTYSTQGMTDRLEFDDTGEEDGDGEGDGVDGTYSHGTWTTAGADRMTEQSQSSSLGDGSTPIPTRRPFIKSEARLLQASSEPATSSGVQMMKHFLDTAESHEEVAIEEMDEIDHFFASMKASVKKFSGADKVLAKREIFNVVNDIEMRMFQENPLMD